MLLFIAIIIILVGIEETIRRSCAESCQSSQSKKEEDLDYWDDDDD